MQSNYRMDRMEDLRTRQNSVAKEKEIANYQEANFDYLVFDMYVVGAPVRVRSSNSSNTQRAIISYINDNETFDVLFASNKEESNIDATRILPLYAHDAQDAYIPTDQLKAIGNTLFSAADYTAALEVYQTALKRFQHELSIGTNVICTKNNVFYAGIISDIHNSAYSVMYDAPIMKNGVTLDEEVDVRIDQIYVIASTMSEIELQRAILMNAARCCFKLDKFGWAIKYSSLILALLQSSLLQDQLQERCPNAPAFNVDKHMADVYYFRSKALLLANRPRLAAKDLSYLAEYEISSARYISLSREIQAYMNRKQRENKQLAKNIAEWVEEAMNRNAQLHSQAANADVEDEIYYYDDDVL